MPTALFVGRFQPLHLGHVHALKKLFRKYNVIIVISIGKKDRNNPFSFNNRKRMVNEALKKYKKRYRVIGIRDNKSDKKWSDNIKRKAKFNVVISGNPWVKRCFKGYSVIKPVFLKPRLYNATRIRKLMRENKEWEKLVPREIIKIIKNR